LRRAAGRKAGELRRKRIKISRLIGALFLSYALAAFGATNERDWKVGRVLDSALSGAFFVTGSVTNTTGTATAFGSGMANTTGSATTLGNTTTLNTNTALSGTVTASGRSTSSTAITGVAVQTNELMIVADKYFYVVRDTRSYIPGALLRNALANRKHGCRFIVGEDIKYAQEKGYLWVLDPDGKECKIPILRQQVRGDVELDRAKFSQPVPAIPVSAAATAPTPATTAPASGLVDVPFTSNPPGALVSFSGMATCYTPCSLKLAPRMFRVTMTLAGYSDWTGDITIEAGKTVAAEMQH
jgi:hypothetical protein